MFTSSKSTVRDIIRRFNREDQIESISLRGQPKMLGTRNKRNITLK